MVNIKFVNFFIIEDPTDTEEDFLDFMAENETPRYV